MKYYIVHYGTKLIEETPTKPEQTIKISIHTDKEEAKEELKKSILIRISRIEREIEPLNKELLGLKTKYRLLNKLK